MHRKKSKKVLVYFFLLIIFSTISNNTINNLKLNKAQKINISGLNENDNQKLLGEIKNLSLKNIFFINKNEIIQLINANTLIESYEVFKKYPFTLNIKIEKTTFYAKINNNGKTFLIGSNGKLTLDETDHINLPYIYGKPEVDEFLKFKEIVDESKFHYQQIKYLYFFPSKRWDLRFKNNILIKLPNNLTNKTLDYLYEFLEKIEKDKIKIVDARIKNQIILNE